MSSRLVLFGRSRRYPLLTVLVAIGFIACGGGSPTDPTDPEPSVSYAADVQPIFDTHCTNCHAIGVFGFNLTGGGDQNGLDLTAGRSYRALVGQPTFQRPDTAPTLRVAPGSPENSYILEKLESSSPKLGERMPLDGPPLTRAQIERIRSWIARGAPND